MMMNPKKGIDIILKFLDLKPEQDFKYNDTEDGGIFNKIYTISSEGYIYSKNYKDGEEEMEKRLSLQDLLNNPEKIIKLPWLPKNDETYFSFYSDPGTGILCIDRRTWKGRADDLAKYKAEWVFKTKEEANYVLPAIAKEFNVGYIGLKQNGDNNER